MRIHVLIAVVACGLASPASAQQPAILSFECDGTITWSNAYHFDAIAWTEQLPDVSVMPGSNTQEGLIMYSDQPTSMVVQAAVDMSADVGLFRVRNSPSTVYEEDFERTTGSEWSNPTPTVGHGNIVGYVAKTISASNDWTMIGITFVRGGLPTFRSVFGEQLEAGTVPQQADLVYMYLGGSTFRAFGRRLDAGQFSEVGTNWFTQTTDFAPLHHGSHALLQPRLGSVDKTIYLSGEVEGQDEVTDTIHPGAQVKCYPFACEIALNDSTLMDFAGAVAGFDLTSADQIIIQDPSENTYHRYYLFYFGHTWEPIDDAPPDPLLRPGCSFWYVHQGGGFDWVEPNPYRAAFSDTSIIITGFSFDASQCTLTWRSTSGTVYDIYGSLDLVSDPIGSIVAASHVVSQGTETTHSFPYPPAMAANGVGYFKVKPQ